MMLSDTGITPGLHANISSAIESLQICFQVTSEVEALIIKNIQPRFALTIKWWKTVAKGFFTTKFYNGTKYAALFIPKKHNTEGCTSVQIEGAAVKQQDKITTKKQAMYKIHVN